METIDKPTAHLLAELLEAYGISRVIVSPGSRCAPLSVVLARSERFSLTCVIDERTAAFVGLGMALSTGEPVALVCTSGSAVLNYAPALAEAYYRRVPLIAISADRPADMLDQRDSQTIRQAHALDAVVRKSVDIADMRSERHLRYANRIINDALSAATGRIPGPVHINMQFDVPLTPVCPDKPMTFAHRINRPAATAKGSCTELVKSLFPDKNAKVMIVAGDMHPCDKLRQSLSPANAMERFAIMAEAQANLPWGQTFSSFPDDCSALPEPDFVLSIGGSLVSARLKKYLRSCRGTRHISLGADDNIVDTFGLLTDTIDCDTAEFFSAFAAHVDGDPGFAAQWYSATRQNKPSGASVAALIRHIADAMPDADFHFSNGSARRYAQLASFDGKHRIDCNRGVSGIEGATSTAIGAAMASGHPTVLVSGDMSAAYDIGALSVEGIPTSFRMVVLDNGGGDIFRAVATTRELPERELYFTTPPRLPLRELAKGYGFRYYETTLEHPDISDFLTDSDAPAILCVKVPAGDAKSLI